MRNYKRFHLVLLLISLTFYAPRSWGKGESIGLTTDVKANLLAYSTAPGSVRGLADVPQMNMFSGQMTYQVPIETPEGNNKQKPSLSLVYDGSIGNGALGVGWTIPIPQIRRSTKLGVPNYDTTDTLELIGTNFDGRLVSLADNSYGLEGVNSSFQIEYKSDNSWLLYDGSGQRYQFGATKNSQRAGKMGVETWYLQEQQDAFGHKITYHYRHHQGAVYIENIAWGNSSRFTVDFIYEDRKDTTISYRTNDEICTALRLKQITIQASQRKLRDYILSYYTSENIPLSRLVRVESTGLDNTAMPPLTFTYEEKTDPKQFFIKAASTNETIDGRWVFADIDQDGLPEAFDFQGRVFLENLGDGWFEGKQSGRALPELHNNKAVFLDIDNDGQLELLYMADRPGGWGIYQQDHNGSWQRIGIWKGSEKFSNVNAYFYLGDINGDGYTDVVVHWFRGNYSLWKGGPDFTLTEWPQVQLSPYAYPVAGKGMYWLDINGDGLLDWARVYPGDIIVALGKGDGTFTSSTRYPFPKEEISSFSQVLLFDFNRDGFADVVTAHGNQVYWYPGLPSGGFGKRLHQIKTPSQQRNAIFVADVNGNGSLDVVGADGWVVDLAGNTTAGMLKEIDNGLGLTIFIYYETSTKQYLDAKAKGDPWKNPLKVPMPIVAQITQSFSDSPHLERSRLEVRNGIWDESEKAFAGFLFARKTELGNNPASSLSLEEHFHAGLGDLRALRGKTYLQHKKSGEAQPTLFETTATQWQLLPMHVDGKWRNHPWLLQPVVVEEEKSIYEGQAIPAQLKTTYHYDQQVRPIEIVNHGRIDAGRQDPVFKKQLTYATKDSSWAKNVVVQEQMLDGDNQVVLSKRFLFDGDEQAPLPYGAVAKGLEREVQVLDLDTLRHVPQQQRRFGQDGEMLWLRENGVSRHFQYDTDNLHPIAESIQPSQDKLLKWKTTWHPVLGLPSKVCLPDTHCDHITYDGLGRVSQVARDHHPPHILHHYHWAGPAPTTETIWQDGKAGERRRMDVHDSRGRLRWHATYLEEDRWQIDGVRRYNDRGLLGSISRAFFSETFDSIELIEEKSLGYGGHQITYDAMGRAIRNQLPNGVTRLQQYLPLQEIRTVANLAPVTLHYNGHGQLIESERTFGGQREYATASYDNFGNMVTRTLQGQVKQQFIYDGWGRLRESVDEEQGRRRYNWSDENQLLQVENGAGETIAYTYDDFGRTIEVRSKKPKQGEVVAKLRYDRGVHGENYKGHLVEVEDESGWTRWQYDDYGQQQQIERSIAGVLSAEQRDYAPSGLLVKRTFDDAITIDYQYDRLGRLQQVGPFWQALSYSAGGSPLKTRYGNGVVLTSRRDKLERPIRMTLHDGKEGLLYDVAATYAAFGALQTCQDHDGLGLSHDANFLYDEGGRLTSANLGGFDFHYTYDPLQNMTGRHVEGPKPLPMDAGDYVYGTHGASNRQIHQAGATTFAYDSAGRVIQAGQRHMTYDAFNRLREVSQGWLAASQHYTYDIFGNQALAQEGGKSLRRFSEDVTDNGKQRTYKIRANDNVVAQVEVAKGAPAQAKSSQVMYLHPTLHVGPSLLSNQQGEIIEERQHEPFGTVLAGNTSLYGYNHEDKPVDTSTGWADHGARWLAASHGQWLSPDEPTAQPDEKSLEQFWDLHPYQYGQQNPLRFHDPDGNAVNLLAAGIGSVTGAAVSAGIDLTYQWLSNQPIDFSQTLQSAARGGLEGFVIGATAGGSLLAQRAVLAVTVASGSIVGQMNSGEQFSWLQLGRDAAVCAVVGSASQKFAKNFMPVGWAGKAPGVSGVPRTGSALKASSHHAFPDLADNFARDATRFKIPTRGPGGQVVRTSELYQVGGRLNGREGVFEWIVDKGVMTHRRFIPGGTVTGFPNQVPGR